MSGSRGLLHRVDCPHLGDSVWSAADGNDLTRQRKVCAAGLVTLRDWGEAEGLRDIRTCSDCQPVDDAQVVAGYALSMLADGSFSSDGAADARRRVLASVVRRQGQPFFRGVLLEAYGGRCAVTECAEEAVLEAAHIIPYRGVWTNHPQNGLLLRGDLHTLFDLGLIGVDTAKMTIVVASRLVDPMYASLAGLPVLLPKQPEFRPSRWALDQHRERCGLTRR